MAYQTCHPFYPMVDSFVEYSSGVPHPTIRLESVPPMLGRFSGDNAEGWIIQAQLYFDFYGISDDHKLSFVSSYLDGAALEWFCWMCRNNQILNWKHFREKLTVRFPERTLADYVFQQSQSCFAPVRSPILDYPSHQVFDIGPQRIFPTINAFSQKNDALDVGNGVHKAFDEMSNRYNNASSLSIDSFIMNIELEISEDLIVPYKNSNVSRTSLEGSSNSWKADLETFDNVYLDEFFVEPEKIEGLYLDIFFMEKEGDSPASEMPSREEIIVVENGKVNEEVGHAAGILSIWANRMISLSLFADSLIFYRTYKECPIIVINNSRELLRNSAYYPSTTCDDHHILHHFPFDPGANLFILILGATVTNNCLVIEIGDGFLSLLDLHSALQAKPEALDCAKGHHIDEFLVIRSFNDPYERAFFMDICWLPIAFSIHICCWVDTGQRLQLSKLLMALFVTVLIDPFMYIKACWLDNRTWIFTEMNDMYLFTKLESFVSPIATDNCSGWIIARYIKSS